METEVTTIGVEDYVVFGVMLAISLGIGIYYAIKDRAVADGGQNYLLASRQMSYIPVGFSICVSFVSAITILGIPAEIYYYGTMYLWFLASILWISPVVMEIYIETFYSLNITTVFEYIELRFDRGTRLFSTAIYIIQSVMYIGITIYAPSLAIDSVTGFNVWAAVSVTGVVCTLYTSIGGLKAVIWTDVFQGVILLIVTIVTLITTSNSVGGFGKVWETSLKGGRIDFVRFDTDPRIRLSFWSAVVGLGFLWLTIFSTNQSQVQRYCCCKSKADAKKGYMLGMSLAFVVAIIIGLTGLVVYAYFETCDPLLTNKIHSQDQVLPYMIVQVYANTPGMSGLFIAGLYAGGLSTVSTGINALACVTMKDFIQPYVNWSPKVNNIVVKALVFLYGALCVGFAFLSSVLGGVVEASLSLLGLVGGPLFGLFTVGMLFPFVHSVAANVGMVLGLALNLWIYIGNIVYPTPSEFTLPKPLSTSGCPTPYENSTEIATTMFVAMTSASHGSETSGSPALPVIANLYHISFGYYTAVGFAATVFSALLLSLVPPSFFGQEKKKVDPRLIVRIFDHEWLRWLPSKFRRVMRCGVEELEVYNEKGDIRMEWSERMSSVSSRDSKPPAFNQVCPQTDSQELTSYPVNLEEEITSFSKKSITDYDKVEQMGKINEACVSTEKLSQPTEL